MLMRKVKRAVKLVLGNLNNQETYTAVASKVITHNLGYLPIVQVLDGSGNVVEPEVVITTTTITVTFVEASTGTILYK